MQWCMPDPSTGMVEARGFIMSHEFKATLVYNTDHF